MQRILVILSALLVILATVCCSLGPIGAQGEPHTPVEPTVADAPVTEGSPVPTEMPFADPPESLGAELPPDLWASITASFNYHPALTDRFASMGADLSAQMPPLHDVQAWILAHPGNAADAFAALTIPPNSEVIPPYELTLDDALDLYLEILAPEIEAARGAAWLANARTLLPAWAEQSQTLGKFAFTTEAYPGAVEAALDGEDPYITWAFSVISPLVDLDALEIIPGTYLVIMRFQFAY